MENQNLDFEMLENEEAAVSSPKKRRAALVAAVICCLAILTTGTYAYFTAEETAYNVITTGVLSMDLVEKTADGEPWPEAGVSGVMPGTNVDKIVYVVNDGSVDFYTRIALEMHIEGEDGAELDFKNITLDINTEDWVEQDGYYYYKRAIVPGEQTEPLFTEVRFGAKLGNAYQNARIEIDVTAQAVQSRNNGDGPLSATGWN